MTGDIEKYSLYEFEIFEFPDDDYPDTKYYYYKIYTDDVDHINWMKTNVIRESDEMFDSAQEARFAAIGHISKLEDGTEPDYDKEPASIDWDERRKLGE
jgi:hypothetical protein